MRILALAIAMALIAQPAWAHHKPNHRDRRPTLAPASVSITHDLCGITNNPHEPLGFQAIGRRCQALRAQLARNPADADLRARCDRLARAISGRACDARTVQR